MGDNSKDEIIPGNTSKTEINPQMQEAIANFIKKIDPSDLVESVGEIYLNGKNIDLKIKKVESETTSNIVNLTGKHNRTIVYWMVGFLTAIILVMTFLVYFNKISGADYLLLIGILVGYIMGLVTQFVMSPIGPLKTKETEQ